MHVASIRIASGLILLLGLTLIGVGWFYLGSSVDSSPELGNIVIGAFVVISSALCIAYPARISALSGANVIFGFWITASPWTYGYAHDLARLGPMIGIGLAITALGAWAVRSTFIAQDWPEVATRSTRH
jgi:hypothetical protein